MPDFVTHPTDYDRLEWDYLNGQICGWIPPTVKTYTPTFAHVADTYMDLPDVDTFLWRFLWKYVDDCWNPQYQKRGTCVGQGFKLLTDTVLAVNADVYGTEWQGRAAVAGIYPGSRVDIAGMPGKWDGSNGSWAADWCTQYGVILLSDLGLADDATNSDEKMAVKWTATREGVPKEWEEVAKTRPFERKLLVTNAREAGKSIQGGHPVANCSNLIPGPQRDKDGFSRVRRSGGHCTLFWGVRYEPFGLLYQNSWSKDWGDGPMFPDDQPDGSVWVNERDANAILRQEDSYALIGPTGFDQVDSKEISL